MLIYLFMFPLILLLLFLSARINSAYHPKLIFKKYINLKNQKLAKLLIDPASPFSKANNAKANRNKMTIVGILCYSLLALLMIFTATMLWLIPEIQTDSFELDSRFIYLAGNTLNEYLPYEFSLILLMFFAGLHFFNCCRTDEKDIKIRRFSQGISIFFSGCSCLAICYLIYDIFH